MDWHEWHTAYDDPTSSLSRRLAAVRAQLARVLALREELPTELISICAGDGRATRPVLAISAADVSAHLVELDAEFARVARVEADRLGLRKVEVRQGDAGELDTYVGVPPADVLLACGVFGNITDDDLDTTVRLLPQLLAPNAAVVWTRGRPSTDPTRHAGDPADLVRDVFGRHGFVEEVFDRPDDADYRVGVHRLTAAPQERVPGAVLFRFVR